MDQNDVHTGSGVMPVTESSENSSNHDNMADLLELEGAAIDFPKQGEIREGVIASITNGQILVSIGAKSEGIISGKEYDLIPTEELKALILGQQIPVFVINPEDSNGNLVLSYVRAREEVSWKQAEELLQSKSSISSKIIGYNKGGLIAPLGNLRGFLPASQISLSRRSAVSGDTPEQRWSQMVGEPIEVCVIEVDRERRRLILSERAVSSETRESLKERVINDLEKGEVRTGRVSSLADFGAFVSINGADGLVHLSEISWERIQHPKEVLEVGQEVQVKIISIDKEKKCIGLSIRQLQGDPWTEKTAKYQEGQLVEATITRMTKFGAFARLEKDLEGLIHISELSEKRIEHPKEVLKEGDVVTLRVIKVDQDNRRIGLSLRRVDSMAYADMDWQMLLEGETPQTVADETPQTAAETPQTVADETPQTVADETPQTVADETPQTAADETPDEPTS